MATIIAAEEEEKPKKTEKGKKVLGVAMGQEETPAGTIW